MNHSIMHRSRQETHPIPAADILSTFTEHLSALGQSSSWIYQLRSQARHFLTWLNLNDIAIESVDDTILRCFRRHDCHCSDLDRRRHQNLIANSRWFMGGALRLVQFLEEQGVIYHLGELDANTRHLDEFLTVCENKGYQQGTLRRFRNTSRHILIWLHRSRISITEFNAQTLENFLAHDCVCPENFRCRRQHVAGAHRYESAFVSFLQHLRQTGVVSVQSMTPEMPPDPAMTDFASWLRRYRGLREVTIHQHVRHATTLVAELGDDPGSYDAVGIREVLSHHYAGQSVNIAKKLATTMRMYLRWLASSGACSLSLVHAVPTVGSVKSPFISMSDMPPRWLPSSAMTPVLTMRSAFAKFCHIIMPVSQSTLPRSWPPPCECICAG